MRVIIQDIFNENKYYYLTKFCFSSQLDIFTEKTDKNTNFCSASHFTVEFLDGQSRNLISRHATASVMSQKKVFI